MTKYGITFSVLFTESATSFATKRRHYLKIKINFLTCFFCKNFVEKKNRISLQKVFFLFFVWILFFEKTSRNSSSNFLSFNWIHSSHHTKTTTSWRKKKCFFYNRKFLCYVSNDRLSNKPAIFFRMFIFSCFFLAQKQFCYQNGRIMGIFWQANLCLQAFFNHRDFFEINISSASIIDFKKLHFVSKVFY